MKRFDIVTIFPHILDSYFNESILSRAQTKKLISIQTHDLRDYTDDERRTIDDRPYGGGPGMLMKVEPFKRAVADLPKKGKRRVILLSPRGKQLTQKLAKTLSKYDQLVFLCGRYEGVDERVKKYIDMELSIGSYVLCGGELGAAVAVEAVARLLPGVLGEDESSQDESFSQPDTLEYPQYTRPEIFGSQRVPKVLLSGNHAKIAVWRESKKKRLKLS